MDKTQLTMLGLQRAEFERAKSNEMRSWACQAIVALATLLSLFSVAEPVVYLATLVSLASVSLAVWFARKSRSQRYAAERARRMLLLVDGLGYRASDREVADIRIGISASESEGRKWEDSEYFQSKIEPGYIRLRRLLQESVFFSQHLYEKSGLFYSRLCGISLIVSMLSLLSLPLLANQAWALTVAKIISTVLMFLVTADLFGRASDFSSAAIASAKIDVQLDKLIPSSANENDSVFILGDFNSIVESAPLIPTFVFRRNAKSLNELWKMRVATD